MMPPRLNFSALIDTVGEGLFEPELLRFLNGICGAEHCSILYLDQSPRRLSSVSLDGSDMWDRQGKIYESQQLWRVDPSIIQIHRAGLDEAVFMARLDAHELPDCSLRNEIFRPWDIRERVILGGKRRDTAIGLSVVRTGRAGIFSKREIVDLHLVGDVLLSLLAKHAASGSRYRLSRDVLGNLPAIETRVGQARDRLTTREAQVCARIIYGITAAGIACDLGITEETVVTYRKRAYDRLGLGCQRELLMWYLDLCAMEVGPAGSALTH